MATTTDEDSVGADADVFASCAACGYSGGGGQLAVPRVGENEPTMISCPVCGDGSTFSGGQFG